MTVLAKRNNRTNYEHCTLYRSKVIGAACKLTNDNYVLIKGIKYKTVSLPIKPDAPSTELLGALGFNYLVVWLKLSQRQKLTSTTKAFFIAAI